MTTTETYSPDEAAAYLGDKDPVLARAIDKFGPPRMRQPGDPFAVLLRSLMYQQLAGKAAAAIMKRMFALYSDDEERVPTPKELAETSVEKFRSASVSRQKAAYLQDLGRRVEEGLLDFDALPAMSDEDVIKKLCEVHGIGEWTAQMFLMFQLQRPDVLPVKDLGVRNGMKIAYGLEATPTELHAKVVGEPWAPYRSVGSWYMWRVVEGVNTAW